MLTVNRPHPMTNAHTPLYQFSLFRSIFRDILSQMKHDDDDSTQTGSRQNLSSGNSDDFSISDQWDALSLHSYSTKESVMSTDASRFRYICNELNAPPDFVEVVGRRLLGLRDKSVENAAAHSGTPNLDKIVDFMADAFIRCTKHANLALLALDDVHWMDEMSWKVVEAIYNRGANVLILCGSRPIDVNPLRLDPKFWSSLQESKVDRYLELFLNPLSEFEVQEMIAITLQLEVDEIDSSFWRNVFTTSGGMPHYLSYVLETIKRDELAMRLENGLMGLKNAASEDTKVRGYLISCSSYNTAFSLSPRRY
jgi:predicted ATPase